MLTRTITAPALLIALAGAPGALADVPFPESGGPFPPIIERALLNGVNGFPVHGIEPSDRAGTAVAFVGDINADGFEDAAIAAPIADHDGLQGVGEVYIVFGRATDVTQPLPILELSSLDGTNGFTVRGTNDGDTCGTSVSRAGDVNGDGIDDLIIGAAGADYLPSRSGSERGGPILTDAGMSYVIFGRDTAVDGDFPVVLDPSTLDGTNGFAIIGVDSVDASGSAVGGGGDINGDGIDDVIIGAPGADPNGPYSDNRGETYVVFGRHTPVVGDFPALLSLSILDGTNGFVINGVDDDDNSGVGVGVAGDLNGDGIDDVAIGATGAGPMRNGRAYVVFGRDAAADGPFPAALDLSALDGTTGFSIIGTPYARAGASVAAGHDVNGDGFDDVLIGGPLAFDIYYEWYSGETYVIFGRDADARGVFPATIDASSLDGDIGFRALFDYSTGGGFPGYIGSSVASADVNADGFHDLFLGAPGEDHAFIVLGGPDIGAGGTVDLAVLDGSDGFAVLGYGGAGGHDQTGTSVAGGDFNADGIGDILVGAPFAAPGGRSRAGEASVIFGRSRERSLAGGVGGSASATLLKAPGFDLSSLNGINGFVVDAAEVTLGTDVAPAGDINADGIDDFVVTAWGADAPGKPNVGTSYVVFGRDSAMGATFPPGINAASLDGTDGFALQGINADDVSGSSAASADVNHDGIDDLIIDAVRADPGGVDNAGETYVVFGRDTALTGDFPSVVLLSSLNGTNGFVIHGYIAGANSARTVAGAGDVNADGVDDIIIGGARSHVVFGRDTATSGPFPAAIELSSLDGTDGFAIQITTGGSLGAGSQVSSAGDINHDGIDDVVVGYTTATPIPQVLLYVGESYVIFGRDTALVGDFPDVIDTASLDGAIGFVIRGAERGEFSATSLASAGDVNDDGIDDLLIGAYGAEANDPNYLDLNYNAGRAYAFFGRDTAITGNFPAVFELSTIDGTNGFFVEGTTYRHYVGMGAAGLGDVNADGIDDVMFGATGADPFRNPDTGECYVVYGRNTALDGPFPRRFVPNDLDGTVGFRISGLDSRDRIGDSIASAGDVNHDGLNDILIGDTSGPRGTAYVIFGDAAFALNPVLVPQTSLLGLTPSTGAEPLPTDLDGSGATDLADFIILIDAFGADPGNPAYSQEADLTGDGVVDVHDLRRLITNSGLVQ